MDRSKKLILMARVIGEYVVSLRRDKEDSAEKASDGFRTLRGIANGQIDIDFYTLVEILTALEEGFAGFT